MSPLVRLVCLGLGLWLLGLAPASGQEKAPEKPWTGKLADGRVITKADLDQIIEDHELWLKSNKKEGSKADLTLADISGIMLIEKINLSGASLSFAKLRDAKILMADLSGSHLVWADLSGASLISANLSGASLYKTNLSGASLIGANLSGAILDGANLTRATLTGANMKGTRFEPEPGSLPGVTSLLVIEGLDSLTFTGTNSFSLVELREIYKKAGMRDEERQVNFALQHTRRVNLWEKNRGRDLLKRELGRLEDIFQLVMLEWTCQYGMSPGRPLKIMGLGLFLLTLPYFFGLRSRNPQTGIWRLLPADRVLDRKINAAPVKLRAKGWGDIRAWRLAFYFSLLSAFHIGWRDLNVGAWFTRIQKREYNLRATGWVRMVSGFQSLLSVYMLALWALTYFGRPFE